MHGTERGHDAFGSGHGIERGHDAIESMQGMKVHLTQRTCTGTLLGSVFMLQKVDCNAAGGCACGQARAQRACGKGSAGRLQVSRGSGPGDSSACPIGEHSPIPQWLCKDAASGLLHILMLTTNHDVIGCSTWRSSGLLKTSWIQAICLYPPPI